MPLRAECGFLIGPHDRPVTNEPTGETFAVGIVTTPVGCRAALGLDPAAVAGHVEELMRIWPSAADLRERLLVVTDPEQITDEDAARLRASLSDKECAALSTALAVFESLTRTRVALGLASARS